MRSDLQHCVRAIERKLTGYVWSSEDRLEDETADGAKVDDTSLMCP